MPNITPIPFPVCTHEDAVAAGFAEFNHNPHLCVDLPNGGFTISAKTTDGRRITFAFQPYQTGGAPQCVDIQYHDGGTFRVNKDRRTPTFNAIIFNGPGPFAYDSREEHPDPESKPAIVCVLMQPTDVTPPAKADDKTRHQKATQAMEHLRAARNLLRSIGADRAAAKVKEAISSTGGAVRHAMNKDIKAETGG
jgi:hypothetical protein